MKGLMLAATVVLAWLHGSQSAECDQDHPEWGEKMIIVPGCLGVGCRANGVDDDCAWCVYDFAACAKAGWGAAACTATEQARKAQGIPTTCVVPPPPKKCDENQPRWGEKMIHVPNCKGAGCRANGVDDDCAWCVYNMSLCSAAFDSTTCMEVDSARQAQGYVDCAKGPAAPPKSCDADFPEWGEKEIIVLGCQGAGCRANGVDDDCAWCVYDFQKCAAQGWGAQACRDTDNARRAQGIFGCKSKSSPPGATCFEDEPTWGEKKIHVPGCEGAGCQANGIDNDCAWCVYDMPQCVAVYGSKTCVEVNDARRAQGIHDCDSSDLLHRAAALV